ncbi:MAG: hypothetical protein IPN71_11650 [Fibrobacteres bacterium]|nr:hypothetical protein [Fibrobacterota bacterium]
MVATLALATAILAAPGEDPIFGKVVDASSRAGLSGVRIVGVPSGRTAWTGSDGSFALAAANPRAIEVRKPPPVEGSSRLVLRGVGVRYDWVSISGKRRHLATAPANVHLDQIDENFGWICSDADRPDRCWSALKVGRNLLVRDSPRDRQANAIHPSPSPESLFVWLPGRAHRTVSAVVSGPIVVELPPVRTVAGDFHTHTYLSDGSHTHDDIAAHAFGGKYLMREIRGAPLRDSVTPGFGLDWYANTDHGGAFPYDRFGKPFTESPEIRLEGVATGGYMWRWQSLRDLSWPVLDSLHRVHSHRHIFQGVEWNVPGHEHASVGILASTPEPIARFEFLFDWADGDTVGGGWPDAFSKILDNSHPKALAGARWLHQHHGDSSWIVINHPSRLRVTFIQDLRDLHDAAGPVFLGIEAVPGHQKHPSRGSYGYVSPPPDHPWNARTWGGADRMLARVGGVMDALWSEGRKVWVFANSDFHIAAGYDHYPGEYHKNITRVSDKSPTSILAGLRRGATVAVMGDLVDSFSLELDDGRTVASMGGELATSSDSVSVVVRYHIPARSALGDSPVVDHIDLIRGEVRGKLLPGDPHYATDSVANVSVVATVSTADLPKGLDGWHQARWRQASDRPSFFRVRGSSLPRGTPGWTDSLGNPLCDELQYPNDDSEARYNRWFYSNPVFLKRR